MSEQFNILVVEDDKLMRSSLVELLEASGWCVKDVPRATRVAECLNEFQPDVILSDVRMPGMSGLELLHSLDALFAPPLVLISAHGDIPMAVQAIQDGAYSFIEKSYEPQRLLTILRHAAEQSRMKKSNQRLKDRLLRLSGLDRVLLGKTPGIAGLRRDILEFIDADAPVLILGETGTGKELVANALHDLSDCSDRPFMALNCATLSPDTFEAEMFGAQGCKGRLLEAAGGTLFLDQVCSCPLPVQAKLLRVIEDKQIFPVGSTKAIPTPFRVLSATNENVEVAVKEKRLRQDLLFRINTVVLNLPALRNRRDDIMLLVTHFLDMYARAYGLAPPEITQNDLASLMAHDWPGNVRELRSVAERRVLAARHGSGTIAQAIRTNLQLDDAPDTLREAVAAFERQLIGKGIQASEGRMDVAAKALGIGRRTLNDKIVKLGLDKRSFL